MKAGTELFDLIKSLDSAEKGYFKKHSLINSSSNTNANYLQLFNSIDAQEEYNEKEIRKKFRDHPFAKQFPVAKVYLYNRILKTLGSYHKSIFKEVQNSILYGEILYYKKLYSQSARVFSKAKQLCVRYDLHFYYQEILRWETNLAVGKYDLNWMDRIVSESTTGMSFVQNSQQYNMLSMRIMATLNRYGSIRKKFLIRKLDGIMKDPLLQNESSALDFTSKVHFAAIHAFYWYAKENYTLAKKYFKRQLALFQGDPEKIKVQFSAYIVSINNLVEMLFQEEAFDEAPGYLDLLQKELQHTHKPAQQATLFYLYNHNLLVYMQRTGQFNAALELLPGILHDYPKHGKELNAFQKTILLIKISIVWFGVKNYSKCLHYLNIIRNELSFKIQPDLNCFLQIYYIIAHYEAGHYDLLPSLATSAENFFKKQDIPIGIENTLINFFKKNIAAAESSGILATAFAQLKKEIKPLSKDPVSKRSFEYFDFNSWVESKIEGRSFAEVIQGKADK